MPAWVQDHEIWEKAKAAVRERKDYDEQSGGNFYAIATAIYKKMGGRIKRRGAVVKAFATGYPLQGRMKFRGLDISIENRKGSVRSGVDEATGKPWRVKMRHPYGYIRGTNGLDKDHIDCFIGPNHESQRVFVVHQIDQKTGKFDEDKVMLGFDSRQQAIDAYRSNYERGWKVGPVEEMDFETFKKKALATGDRPAKIVKALYPSRAHTLATAIRKAVTPLVPILKPGRKLTLAELGRALRIALATEQEAIQLYEELAEATDHDLAKRVLQDIAREEAVHVGEFQALIERIVDTEEEDEERGEAEVEKLATKKVAALKKAIADTPAALREVAQEIAALKRAGALSGDPGAVTGAIAEWRYLEGRIIEKAIRAREELNETQAAVASATEETD